MKDGGPATEAQQQRLLPALLKKFGQLFCSFFTQPACGHNKKKKDTHRISFFLCGFVTVHYYRVLAKKVSRSSQKLAKE